MAPKPKCPRAANRWTLLKLTYLSLYLDAFVVASKTAKERSYLDGFAGCGECKMNDTGQVVAGSALRALRVSPAFTECHFVELDEEIASCLTTKVASFSNAHVYTGDCNVVIPRQVLPNMSRLSASLAFLDPPGLQLHWATIVELAKHRDVRRTRRKMELLILYPHFMAVAANLFNTGARPTLSLMFGGDGWCTVLEDSRSRNETRRQRGDTFARYYCDRLRSELGYQYVDQYGPLYDGRRPLYYVVHASDHEAGPQIMRNVWSQKRPRILEDELQLKLV